LRYRLPTSLRSFEGQVRLRQDHDGTRVSKEKGQKN
jgi:hypothetical protein